MRTMLVSIFTWVGLILVLSGCDSAGAGGSSSGGGDAPENVVIAYEISGNFASGIDVEFVGSGGVVSESGVVNDPFTTGVIELPRGTVARLTVTTTDGTVTASPVIYEDGRIVESDTLAGAGSVELTHTAGE